MGAWLEVVMLGLCDMVLRLLAREPSTTRRAQTEAAAIAELYYQRSPGLHVDPGLVERLLWWEGIDPAEVQRDWDLVTSHAL